MDTKVNLFPTYNWQIFQYSYHN